MDGDAVCFKRWTQLFQRRLDLLRHLERVGGILFRHVEDHAGSALDARAADGRFGRVDDVGHIPQGDARGPSAQKDGPGNVVRLERLSLGLKDDSLVPGVDEAGPPDAG